MADHGPYPTPRAVENAIKDAAKKAAAADPSLDVGKRIQLEHFNRFLSRVFSDGPESEWVLKGGTGILARVPSTRSTRDIDLYREGFTLTDALADLIRLAARDLCDHFTFQYSGRTDSIGTENQPYTDGFQVKFEILIGAASKGTLHVDMAVGAGPTSEVVTVTPAGALALPRLVSNPYRLYPVVDQIADKVCATMTQYHGKASSREKDLVDLVVFATTQDVDGAALRVAIATEAGRRKMEPFNRFVVPSTWGHGYAKLSKPVPYCAEYPTAGLAAALVSRLIDPALAGDADGMLWNHPELEWVPSTSAPSTHQDRHSTDPDSATGGLPAAPA